MGGYGHVYPGDNALSLRIDIFPPADDGMLCPLHDQPRKRPFKAAFRSCGIIPARKEKISDGRFLNARPVQTVEQPVPDFFMQLCCFLQRCHHVMPLGLEHVAFGKGGMRGGGTAPPGPK